MDAQKFGSFVAQIRKENKMTQADLAGKIHVTDKAVSRWERGLGFPDMNTIEPLAEALGISVVELMKSERLSDTALSPAAASEAITDTLGLAEQQKKQMYDTLVIAACILFGGLVLFSVGITHILSVVLFFCATGGMAIGGRVYLSEKDPVQKKIYGFGIAASYIIASGASVSMLSEPLLDRYGPLIILLTQAIYCIVTLRVLIRRIFLHRQEGLSKLAWIRAIFPYAFAFLLSVFTLIRSAGRA